MLAQELRDEHQQQCVVEVCVVEVLVEPSVAHRDDRGHGQDQRPGDAVGNRRSHRASLRKNTLCIIECPRDFSRLAISIMLARSSASRS
ncbi:Uncharacterised protein [Mycobacteroides abscessus subsp. abscessus]|nr:Uncharacterised protein [Mycobacteroides abscessus subsp. abscessus]